jgi:hypothetical protein
LRLARLCLLLALRDLSTAGARSTLVLVALVAATTSGYLPIAFLNSVDDAKEKLAEGVLGRADLRLDPIVDGRLNDRTLREIAAVAGVRDVVPLITRQEYTEIGRVHVLGVDCRVEALVGAFECDPATVASADASSAEPQMLLGPRASALRTGGAYIAIEGRPVSLRSAVVVEELGDLAGGRVVVLPLPVAQQLYGAEYDVAYARVGGHLGDARDQIRDLGAVETSLVSAGPPAVNEAIDELLPLLTVTGFFGFVIGAACCASILGLSTEQRRESWALLTVLGAPKSTKWCATLFEGVLLGVPVSAVAWATINMIMPPILSPLRGAGFEAAGLALKTSQGSFAPLVVSSATAIVFTASSMFARSMAPRRLSRAAVTGGVVGLAALLIGIAALLGRVRDPFGPGTPRTALLLLATTVLAVTVVGALLSRWALAVSVVHTCVAYLRPLGPPEPRDNDDDRCDLPVHDVCGRYCKLRGVDGARYPSLVRYVQGSARAPLGRVDFALSDLRDRTVRGGSSALGPVGRNGAWSEDRSARIVVRPPAVPHSGH